MMVSCSKCQSRYQLPEEKIKATGTKVRCPRCQNTFKVFPTGASASSGIASPTGPVKEEIPVKAAAPEAPAKVSSPFSEKSAEKFTAKSAEKPTPKPPEKQPPAPSEADHTEFFARRNVLSLQTSTSAASQPEAEDDDFNDPSDITQTKPSRVAEENDRESATQTKKASPFKRPIDDVSVEDFPSDSLDGLSDLSEPPRQEEKSEEKEEKQEPLRPFGDATFLAIQRMARPKKKSFVAIAVVAAIVIAVSLSFLKSPQAPAPEEKTQPVAAKSAPASPQKTQINRPRGWYKDDPTVYQDYLSQIAARPIPDQQKPEARAQLAEALILNGILSGASDQVSSGMVIASSLMAANPQEAHGFYGLITYSLWKDDLQTISDLVARWPDNNRRDPEYRLGKIVVEGRAGKMQQALQDAKSLLSDHPDFQRAVAWTLNLSLESPQTALSVLGEKTLADLQKSYLKHREFLKSNGDPRLALYIGIDKKLNKNGFIAEKESSTEAPSAARQRENASTKDLNEKAAKKLETTQKTDKPEKIEKAEKTEKAEKIAKPESKKLPKPSPDLVAANTQAKKEVSAAEKLFQRGNELYKQNKVDEALVEYQKALQLNSDYADVYKRLGMIYMNRQEKDRALRSFKIYLQLKPEGDDKQVVEGWISSLQ